MGTSVIAEGEVSLNNVKFPLAKTNLKETGRVMMSLRPRFPGKQQIGDDSYANEQDVSNWIMNDWSHGIGIEKLDIGNPAHFKRSNWSSCDGEHRGFLSLPPLVVTTQTLPTLPTIVDGELDVWTGTADLTNWPKSGSGSLTQEATTKKSGNYSARMIVSNGQSIVFTQNLTGFVTAHRGKPITISAWVDGAPATGDAHCHIQLIDDDGTTETLATLDSTWRQVKVTRTVGANATYLAMRALLSSASSGTATVYVDLFEIAAHGPTMGPCCNYNLATYFAWGACLIKLDSTGALTLEGIFPNTITALISSIGSCLYVFLGDTDQYWYINTSGTFTQTTSAGGLLANFGIEWGTDKLFKIDTTGQMAYSLAPNSATPSWTNNGKIELPSNYVKNLCIGATANGVEIIYASTRVGLYAHDYTNVRWLATNCTYADSANNGLGLARWEKWLYVSAGWRVLRYSAEAGIVQDAGLDQDDGIAGWVASTTYISDLLPSFNHLYAFTHGVSTHYVFRLYNDGWHIIYCGVNLVGTTAESHKGITSSVYANRIWFDASGTLKWLALYDTLARPGKISGFTYDFGGSGYAPGRLVTPKFDAGNYGAAKLALNVSLTCSGMSNSETIAVYYQTTFVDSLAEGQWTLLGTVTANGLTTFTFGTSAVGITFRAIRFMFMLVRSNTTTLSPCLEEMVLSYQKGLDLNWAYSFRLDCSQPYAGNTEMALESALKTAADSQVLVPFAFKDSNKESTTPHYVKVVSCAGSRETGQAYQGYYDVTVVEP